MTEKENYLSILRGEQPEWLPKFSFGGPPGTKAATVMVSPKILSYHFAGDEAVKDIWGVAKGRTLSVMPLPYTGTAAGSANNVGMFINGATTINLRCGANQAQQTGRIYIEYEETLG